MARAMADPSPDSVHPSSVVNPYLDHAAQPAPMGLADFGVTANGTGYAYSTSAFLGTISIQSLAAHYKFTSGGTNYYGTEISLQLNAELVLSHAGKANISYWMQDVVVIETTTNQIAFNNNIWNFSSGGGLGTGSIVGNGSIQSGTVYVDVPSASDPGTDVFLHYPANVSAEMVASTVGGVPHVGFAYNDGFGWVIYDNVSLPWATAWSCDGFVVDGFAYAPIGVYYDVEWVEGGPGNGVSDTQDKGNFTMGLEYWNGHNFQAIENAYNFGGNTAEGMQSVVTAYVPAKDGVPLAHDTAGTSSHLGMLYTRSDVAVLNVSSIYAESNLTIGSDHYRMVGREVNLTLAPGTYTLSLYNGSTLGDHRSVTLTAGEYLAITMGHLYYPTWFNESGLPASLLWSVLLGNQTYTSSNGSIQVVLWEGTYAYSITEVAGYYLPGSEYSGTVDVSGPTRLSFTWAPFVYPVSAASVGLPIGVPWSLGIENSTYASTNDTITFSLPNGTYTYTVTADYRFKATDPTDLLTVAGQAVSLGIPFVPRYATLSGTVRPSMATISINGVDTESGEPNYIVVAEAGTYEVMATLSGYRTFDKNVTLTPGNATVQNVVLDPLPATTSNASSAPFPWLGGGWSTLDTLVVAAVFAVAVMFGLLWKRPWRKG